MKISINKNAPVVQSEEIEINAKPVKVWEVLSDIDKWSDWNRNIKNPQTLSVTSVGSKFK